MKLHSGSRAFSLVALALLLAACHQKPARDAAPPLRPLADAVRPGPAKPAAPTPEICDPRFFDRENLLAFLARNPAVATVDELIRYVPDCFKANQAAIYDSGSLQCATPRAPRIALYLNDEQKGNTVCTFNSGVRADYADFYRADPKADCHEGTLECEHFNSDSSRFEFFELATAGTGLKLSEVNPVTCLKCHKGDTPFLGAPNPRPNLENYPAWPGFYGSMHDKLYAAPAELDHYLNQFMKYKPANPRYAALPEVLGADGRYHGSNSKPTVNLHNLLEGQDQQRIAAEFTAPASLNRIWPFRYAILGALACDDNIQTSDDSGHPLPVGLFEIESFVPESLRARMKFSFAQTAATSLQNHLLNLQSLLEHEKRAAGEFHFDQFEDELKTDLANRPNDQPYASYKLDDANDYWNSARLAYLAANLGLPIDDWSMTVGTTLDFEAGDRNLRQVLPLIEPWLLDKSLDQDIHLSLDTYLGKPLDPEQCGLLRTRSLRSLSDPAAEASLQPDFHPVDGPNYLVPPRQLSRCIGCHVVGGHAPPIPFDNPGALKAAFVKGSTTDAGKTAAQEITARIESESMPVDGKLSDAQKAELEAYFAEVAK